MYHCYWNLYSLGNDLITFYFLYSCLYVITIAASAIV